MNFTEEVKTELLQIKDEPCCNNAGLSAYIKGAGTLDVKQGNIGFTLSSESVKILNYFAEIMQKQYSEEPYNVSIIKRIKAEFLSENTRGILLNLGIIEASIDGGVDVNFGIDRYVVENECCKKAYVRGAFLASGSVTLPDGDKKIGYHLEFIFSSYTQAADFCEILLDLDLMPKLIERKGYVVYFNSTKDVLQVLKVLGAQNALKKAKKVIKDRQNKNDSNRRYNCDMSNISKQVNAFLKQKEAINTIETTIGLDKLSEELKATCLARLKYPDSSLEDLALSLNISKSCLNHRLRKIVEISKNLS